ncbi:FecR family protein [Paraflavitalea pollutisoli]|uniref:FecR family protein n=1 Tax=Paraflavitalea pollutisoli TaxID=3034143 RepID=UPI0023ED0497|nr:FecR domain-containing protein [Paraflavitalea sp. H1-2-19X]
MLFAIAGVLLLVFYRPHGKLPDNHAIVAVQVFKSTGGKDTLVMIELANGVHLPIGKSDTGILAQQGSSVLYRDVQGQIIYSHWDTTTYNTELTNKITTMPRHPVQVVLPDHTTILLEPYATLGVPIAPDAHRKAIELSGPAYFSVANDTTSQLSVSTNGLVIEATAAEFLVKVEGDDKTIIGLVAGNAAVAHGARFARLKAGEVLRVSVAGQFEWIRASLSSLMSFRKNTFYFSEAPLSIIKTEIERWYAVQIVDDKLADSISTYHFGPVSRDLPLQAVMKKLTMLTGHSLQAIPLTDR